MTPTLLVTRPAGAAPSTAAAARAAGFAVVAAPLLRIVDLPWQPPAAGAQAILFTSAEAPGRLAHDPLLRSLPAYAVGARTAAAASAAGFAVRATGNRDAAAALEAALSDGVRHLLHPGGRDRAALDLPSGIRADSIDVYAAVLVDDVPEEVLVAMRHGEIFATLLYSPRTAAQFAYLMDRAAIARAGQRLVVLSPAVACAAGTGWLSVAVADAPAEREIFAAARTLWQEAGHG